MDIANEFGNWLEDSNFGTVGTDIFVGTLPAEQDGIYIVRGGGGLNNYIPVEETILDLYVRDTSGATGVQTLEAIKRHAHRMHNTNTDNAYIYSILALGDIEDLDRDIEYNKIYKITLQLVHRSTAVIS